MAPLSAESRRPARLPGTCRRRVLEPRRRASRRERRGQDALREVIAHTRRRLDAWCWPLPGSAGASSMRSTIGPTNSTWSGRWAAWCRLRLGLALARPDLRVVALDGDGAALMRLGAFATVGAYAPPNLWHLLLDNGAHDSTGGQATVSARISFAGVAAACGYAAALETEEVEHIAAWLDAPALAGPRFACLLTRTGTPAGSAAPLGRPRRGQAATDATHRRRSALNAAAQSRPRDADRAGAPQLAAAGSVPSRERVLRSAGRGARAGCWRSTAWIRPNGRRC